MSIKDSFSPGEKIIVKAGVHWFTLVPSMVVFAVALFFFNLEEFKLIVDWIRQSGWKEFAKTFHEFVKLYWKEVGLPLFFMVLSALIFMRNLSRIMNYVLLVTNERVVVKGGTVSSNISELYLHNIESISISQPTFGKMLNFGNIYFNSVGYGALVFPLVSRPNRIRRATLAAIDAVVEGVAIEERGSVYEENAAECIEEEPDEYDYEAHHERHGEAGK